MQMGYRLLALVIGLGLALLVSSLGLQAEERRENSQPGVLIVGDRQRRHAPRGEGPDRRDDPRHCKTEADKTEDRFPQAGPCRSIPITSISGNGNTREARISGRPALRGYRRTEALPRKVVYRLDRIVRARRSADNVLSRAEEMLNPDRPVQALESEPATSPPKDSPSPSPSPSPAASPSPSSGTAQPIRPAAVRTPTGAASSAPAVVSTPASAPRVTTWRVQVGSFAALASAQELVNQLKAKSYESRIDHSTRNGVNLFRVYVGSSADRQGAQTILDKLKKDGFNQAFLVAPDEG